MAVAIVAGAVANKCDNGGEAWVRLSWIRGLQKLGFDVFFVEQITSQNCRDASGKTTAFEASRNCKYFQKVIEDFNLGSHAALIYEGGKEIWGLSRQDLLDAADAAVLLVNISGHLDVPFLMDRIRHKAYIDIDPGYTQLWHAQGNDGARLAGHDSYFTIGENIGRAECRIPTNGIPWRTTRQPVVLDDWPVTLTDNPRSFTTVANWRGGYGAIEFQGKKLGQKAHEFRKYLDLPQRTEAKYEIALQIHPQDVADRNALEKHHWHLVTPHRVAATPDSFRQYVQQSGAEFSVAQGIYVDTRSGWFSDRSVKYLASGKPVLVQDTGLGTRYSTGEGLVLFQDLDGAQLGVERIRSNYEDHCCAARQIAESHFDSDKVLGRLIEELELVT